MRSFLDLRITDGVIRRMIDKWLSAGVLEEGTLRRSDTGTPQGGVVSPLLANVYLHHVLDDWFEHEVKPRLRGRCQLVRYADDIVLAFEDRRSAERLLDVLGKRLGRYGLELHETKTRLVDFRPNCPRGHDHETVFDSSSTVGKLNLLGINKLIGAENPCHYIPVRDAILHDSAYEPGSVFPSSILI